jgi:hypothetical protein
MEEFRLNLITGRIELPTDAELAHEERMTELTKKRLGKCDCACRYTEPFGWVPECGCPIHDPD